MVSDTSLSSTDPPQLYNFVEQFWFRAKDVTGGPSARWGAAGGTDPTAPQNSLDLSTTLYVAGGSNDHENFPLSDIWKLKVLGVLAANSQDIQASWEKVSTGHQDTFVGQANTVMPGGKLVVAGGCAPGASVYNATCATQSAFSVATNPLAQSWSGAGACPAARFSASIAPNLNLAYSTFTSQAFMLFGAIDRERWSGDDADDAEVAVLDVDQGQLAE